jgi:type VI secretion system secreted protein VgrG
MPATTQERHLLSLATPLGDNVLVLSSFTGEETMSRLFTYQLRMWSENEDIAPEDIVGQNVTWAATPYAKGSPQDPRYFNGYVSRFAAGGHDASKTRTYRMEVVPWLWFLTRTANCRMFQNKTVKEIIKIVFDDAGFTDYKLDGIKGKHPTHEYCVQYRETAFNFVSRLMEQEGIFYFFRHEDGKHTLILADQAGAYYDCKENQVIYRAGSSVVNRIDSWEHHYEFRSGKWVQTDYNFETPKTSLLSEPALTVVPVPNAEDYELFDYPGEYTVPGDGKNLTELRMGEEEQSYDSVHASSECRSFSPGGKFTVKEHEIESEQGKSYVITSVKHMATETGHEGSTAPSEYHNSFTCIPASKVFHPARLTPKPFVQGPQPAVVVGPKGQEIYTDKYGRIKVLFFWDREHQKKRDENSSCWIRVAQVWAGKRWGASFWPRIGQEVIVGFLEGDPDRPLVIGSVYNADQMPPYLSDGKDPAPDEKHKNDNKVSGIKSNTTPGGKGYNELRFDDTQGKEQVFVHAEHNMDVRVKNDSMERVIGNRHLVVGWEKDGKKGGDQREMVYQDKHLNIKRNQIEHIEGSVQLLIGKGEAEDGGRLDVVIEKKKTEQIGREGYDSHVQGPRTAAVDGADALTVGGEQDVKVTGTHTLQAKMIQLKADTIVIEAEQDITIVAGSNFITLGSSGIAIQGTMVNINCGGMAGGAVITPVPSPADPQEAKPTKPAIADDSKTGFKSAPTSE